MTRLEMRTETRAMLNDESTTPALQRFSDTKINFRINEIHKEVGSLTRVLKSSATDSLATSVREYALPEGTDVLDIERVEIHDNTVPTSPSIYTLVPTSMEEMDGKDRFWKNVEGRPARWYQRGNLLGFDRKPGVPENGFVIKIFFAEKVNPLSLDTDSPRYPDVYHKVVIWGTVGWCKQEDNDFQEVNYYENKYEKQMAKMKAEQDARKGTIHIMKPSN